MIEEAFLTSLRGDILEALDLTEAIFRQMSKHGPERFGLDAQTFGEVRIRVYDAYGSLTKARYAADRD